MWQNEKTMIKLFKIERKNGKLVCPELPGYKLPELEPEPIGQPLTDYIKQMKTQWQCMGFIDGYNKAREKYEFTESQIEKAILFGARQQHMFGYISNDEERKFIQSIRTPRLPVAIEVEIIRVTLDGTVFPAINPDGTVKGRYIYE